MKELLCKLSNFFNLSGENRMVHMASEGAPKASEGVSKAAEVDPKQAVAEAQAAELIHEFREAVGDKGTEAAYDFMRSKKVGLPNMKVLGDPHFLESHFANSVLLKEGAFAPEMIGAAVNKAKKMENPGSEAKQFREGIALMKAAAGDLFHKQDLIDRLFKPKKLTKAARKMFGQKADKLIKEFRDAQKSAEKAGEPFDRNQFFRDKGITVPTQSFVLGDPKFFERYYANNVLMDQYGTDKIVLATLNDAIKKASAGREPKKPIRLAGRQRPPRRPR